MRDVSGLFLVLPRVRESKTVLDTGFHAMNSGFQVLDSRFQLFWDSGFLEQYSIFQSPGFWIPQAKISWIPESVFPYMGRLVHPGI